MSQLIITGIAERDIDLLILEEFFVSPDFVRWFVGEADLPNEACRVVTLARSVSSSTGESDIELTLKSSEGFYMLLIENKIAAILQPRQAERYRERADCYVREGRCTQCRTVLVAPKGYLGDPSDTLGFDKVVTYEAILDWLESNAIVSPRSQFKATLLENALGQGSVTWKLVPDDTITEFWRRYWDLAKALGPELRMPRPGAKPATSTFIYFHPHNLPRGVKLIHKALHGNVDLQFAGMANNLDVFQAQYGNLIEPGMVIESASKSGVIRINVPEIDPTAPFPDSEPAVREALWAAKLLLLWYRKVQS
jgi:hypothetical protein